MQHSEIGASSAERWFNCPGSVQASRGIEQKESPYAAEGTKAHDFAEKCLTEGLSPMEVYQEHDIPQEMAEAVQVYVDEVDRILEKEGEDAEIMVEQKFHLPHIDEEAFGTSDCMIYVPFKKLYVFDYKHGQGKSVHAKENKQQLYYALGAYQGMEVEEIELIICQPRCHKPGHEKISRWVITPEKLEEFEKELKEAVKKTKEKNPELHAGDHCQFCPAAKTCPKLAESALEACQQDFKDTVVRAKVVDLPRADELSPLTLSRVLKSVDLIEKWIKEVRELAHERMENGETVPDFKLVKKRSHRKWRDEEAVKEELGDLFEDEIYNKKLRSPAQVEKALGKENKELIQELSYYPDSGVAIAPESDKRPAVNNKASLDFEDL